MSGLRAACIHGRYEDCPAVFDDKEVPGLTHPCPGGRGVAIDYEAAGREWVATISYDQQYEWDDPQAVEIVKGIVDALLIQGE